MCITRKSAFGCNNGGTMKNRLRDRLCPNCTAPVYWVVFLLSQSKMIEASILTSIPMQGGMLMPVVSYHANTDSITVDTSSIRINAQLTPLAISNPNDSFDPADPWFNDLDPGQKGLAFSRRYGFDMDPNTDLLPEDRQIWIRKMDGSPDLSIYDYSASSVPKRWMPIFGTGGSSNAAAWSGLMWHVGVAAPSGTNDYTATFEVYVVNVYTGGEVAGSSSVPFTLKWTSVPDGRPVLKIGNIDVNDVVISWPENSVKWKLLSSESLYSTNWAVVTNQNLATNGQVYVRIEKGTSRQFYRLQQNP